jgi:D-lactate dehydrogenase (cytochrome)
LTIQPAPVIVLLLRCHPAIWLLLPSRSAMDNRLTPESFDIEGIICPRIDDPRMIREGYSQYTTDESRFQGNYPQRIYFPRTTLEVASAVTEVAQRGEKMTISGARTGIVGGAAPQDSAGLLCLENLTFEPTLRSNESSGRWTVTVAAGTTVEELQRRLRTREYRTERRTVNGGQKDPPSNLFYPVDPTETSASLGGTAATNASGARTLYYGPTRDWIAGLTVVLADGRILHLERGAKRAARGEILLDRLRGETQKLIVPDISMPNTKHTAGYHLATDMDPIDLFIGAEGTLAVITEIELKLELLPEGNLYLTIFLPSEDCTDLIHELKQSGVIRPVALEYMDSRSLDLLRQYKAEQSQSSGVPEIPQGTGGVLYLELRYDAEEELEGIYESLAAILAQYDIDIEATWAGFSSKDLEAMKRFRHALPERINSIIASRKKELPTLTKIGTDMAVPDEALSEILRLYHSSLNSAGLEYCIFGHIGSGHLHVNILPHTEREKQKGLELYSLFAERAVFLGGSVAAEHGIGKLKKKLLKIQYTDPEIQSMKAVKEFWDPHCTFNPGVLFE